MEQPMRNTRDPSSFFDAPTHEPNANEEQMFFWPLLRWRLKKFIELKGPTPKGFQKGYQF